jgi:hypothetical protein
MVLVVILDTTELVKAPVVGGTSEVLPHSLRCDTQDDYALGTAADHSLVTAVAMGCEETEGLDQSAAAGGDSHCNQKNSCLPSATSPADGKTV